MRLLLAVVMGVGSAGAGFSAGLLGTIVMSPWTGAVYPAVTIGVAAAAMTTLSMFGLTLWAGRLKHAVAIGY